MIIAERLPGMVCSVLTDKALKCNADLRILFRSDSEMEFVDFLYPHIMFVPNRDRLKILTKEKIDNLIAEKTTEEEK